jgi:hypothetical protein
MKKRSINLVDKATTTLPEAVMNQVLVIKDAA